jgi:hypothetical protein
MCIEFHCTLLGVVSPFDSLQSNSIVVVESLEKSISVDCQILLLFAYTCFSRTIDYTYVIVYSIKSI